MYFLSSGEKRNVYLISPFESLYPCRIDESNSSLEFSFFTDAGVVYIGLCVKLYYFKND